MSEENTNGYFEDYIPDDLPETYMGYKTADLLEFWDRYCTKGLQPDATQEKVNAMHGLLREYEIAPVYRM